MPRNGSGVYSADWVNASPNTTIESAKQNAMVADLVADANAARPVTAGGTGETTARLKDGTWRFQNTADTTKLLAFDLSGITTATTRTLTAPNASGTLMLTSTGITNDQALAGSIIQTASASYTANSDISTAFDFDDTIPQNTEGTQIVEAVITPRSATNRIRVIFSGAGSLTGSPGNMCVALFKDSGASAIAANYVTVPTANYVQPLSCMAEFVAGGVAEISIKVRVGPTSGTMRLNGTAVTRLFGGVMQAYVRIEEIKA